MFKQVFELDRGDVFLWERQPNYLHQMTDERDENDSPIANNIATKNDDGKWRFHEPRPQNWNPYCDVKVVKISIK